MAFEKKRARRISNAHSNASLKFNRSHDAVVTVSSVSVPANLSLGTVALHFLLSLFLPAPMAAFFVVFANSKGFSQTLTFFDLGFG
jgi:hypothetical protein